MEKERVWLRRARFEEHSPPWSTVPQSSSRRIFCIAGPVNSAHNSPNARSSRFDQTISTGVGFSLTLIPADYERHQAERIRKSRSATAPGQSPERFLGIPERKQKMVAGSHSRSSPRLRALDNTLRDRTRTVYLYVVLNPTFANLLPLPSDGERVGVRVGVSLWATPLSFTLPP